MTIKGVIVAAGYGSRFLPATKTLPKEMLPLIDKPAISFIVDEFLEAGIRDILIITSRRKKVLDDFFDREVELETVFTSEGDQQKLQSIQPADARFYFTRQRRMLGTGHALLLAKTFTGKDPFVVAYPDDIIFSKTSLSRQLIDAYEKTGKGVLAVKDMSGDDVSRYGVVDPLDRQNPCAIRALVEKPAPGQEPSSLVSYGRYLYTHELYPLLEEGLKNHQGGEFYHVDAINTLAKAGRMCALNFEGLRLDTGDPMGFLEAVCRYALRRPEWSKQAKTLFQQLAESQDS